jgi:phospholipid/cholesterol/gamma-HCH transport system ATP-binding protein
MTDQPTIAKPVIAMSGVSVSSLKDPQSVVLEGVDWTVNAGEYWVLGGMQGAGKSDLLSLAAGLTAPERGDYRLFGNEMPIFEGELLTERLRVGLVFDGGQLLHQLTVRENVALPLRYHRDLDRRAADRRVTAMLELTELLPWADMTPGALGRNIQKRAGLARALMLQPELLLLDNPLGGLDMRQAGWWLNFLEQLAAGHDWMEKRRVTLVATAEDFRPWRERASHFAVLKNKRLVPIGERELLAGHDEPLVKELLAEMPHIN